MRGLNSDFKKEMLKTFAKENEEIEKERQVYPLSRYSTTQLKAELRRRKGERK